MKRIIILAILLTAFTVTSYGWAAPTQGSDNNDGKSVSTGNKPPSEAVSAGIVVPASKNQKLADNSKAKKYPVSFPQNEKVHKNFEMAQKNIANNLKTEMDKVSGHLPPVYQTSAKTNKSAALVAPQTSASPAASSRTADKETV
jgi:excinuclease UvrABC nuclease subunit